MKRSALLLLSVLALPAMAAPKMMDADKDGVNDTFDQCANTPQKSIVNNYGCQKGERDILAVDVNFATKSTIIHDQYLYQVQQLADFLKSNPKTKVEIVGYADPEGDVAFNRDLSLRRAQAIRDKHVSSYGVKDSQVTAVGVGEATRVPPHQGVEGKYRNRRVEARIIE